MYDYKGLHELKEYYTIPEACEFLGLDINRLRYQCMLNCILPARQADGTLLLDKYNVKEINNELYMQQCREGVYDDNPWD